MVELLEEKMELDKEDDVDISSYHSSPIDYLPSFSKTKKVFCYTIDTPALQGV